MQKLKLILKYLLAVFFVLAGLNHFRDPDFYLKMMPPYLPWHPGLVYISGLFEIMLGLMLLIPGYSRLGAWGTIALLIAVFPANLHMAMNAAQFAKFSPTALWIRLPLQAVFVAWAYWYTGPQTQFSG